VAVVVLASVVLMGNVQRTRFRGDESGWISAGLYYTDLLVTGHASWEQWACPSCGAWGRLNPQLGKWLVGIPVSVYSDLRLQGARFDRLYDFDETLEENMANGRVPSSDLLFAARRASVVFGVLSCALLFAIGYASANLATGLLAAGLMLTNRIFVSSATSAMTDIHYLFFLLCLAMAALWLVKRPSTARWAAVACGVFAGLACSVKLTGIAVGGLFFLLVVAYSLISRRLSARQGIGLLGWFLLAALVSVIALNPYFWPSLAGVRGPAVWSEVRALGGETAPIALLVDGLPSERFPQLAKLARPLEFPLMALRWSDLMDRQASGAGWNGISRLIEIHRELAGRLSSIPLLWIAGLAGLGVSARRLWTAQSSRRVAR
jgi:4-amino-4-deoxy-L-arabinose transferase-like glycosyltransferase